MIDTETITYQKFVREATTPEKTADFIRRAIHAHEDSDAYKEAAISRRYYNGENVTISERQNYIYGEDGTRYKDIWSPNHKVKSHFYQMAVDSRTSYLSANGVTFSNPETKSRLGTPDKPLDTQVFLAAMEAYIGGRSYSFFNNDHIEIFTRETYAELKDDTDGRMRGGLRYWRLASDTPLNVFLFLEDGYTVFTETDAHEFIVKSPKRAYRQIIVKSGIGETVTDGEPYPFLPIVPLAANRDGRPLLHGKRETIDALDIMRSVGVNRAVTDAVYWLFEGLQGMKEADVTEAVASIIRCHALATPPAGSGAAVKPEVLSQPFEGTKVMIEEIKEQLNADFNVMNPQQIVSGSDTATAIHAAYEPLNTATNVFELLHLQPYVSQILALAGIHDTFSFKRDANTNVQEWMQTLIMLAPYVDEQYIREAGMTLLGDVDKIEEVSRRMDADAAARLSNAGTLTGDGNG